MRASRLVSLLLLLQERREATASSLASELEVSVRTIYRDVAALQAAGVPLWTEPGHGGGIRLLDGWTGRLDGIALDEAGALFLAGTIAQASVLRTLPRDLSTRAGRIRSRFHVDAPEWFSAEEPVPHLEVVATAVWTDRRLRIRYVDAERLLDPLGLVLKAGRWYLVAASRGTPRTYRLSKVTAAEVLDERAVRPEGFDLASHWASAAVDFDRAIRHVALRLRIEPGAERRVQRALTLADPLDAGEVDVPAETVEVAAHQLLSVGPGVEVLEPPEVRARLRELAAAVAAANA